MSARTQSSIVGVFHDQAAAQCAVRDLRQAGFTDAQIGVIGRDSSGNRVTTSGDGTESHMAEGATTGLAAGAGLGALWGLGVISNVLPVIGPAIVGGTLGVILSSAAAGAAAAGLAGALIGLGLPDDEAKYYDSEFQAGRTLVTVTAPGREAEARTIMQRNGAYDSSSRPAAGTSSTSVRGTSSLHDTPASSDACRTGATHTAAVKSSTAQPLHNATSASSGNTVRAVEERLDVHKTPVQSEVSIHKEVHTEKKTIDVPVTREEVVIERRTPGTAASLNDSGRQEVRIPVMEEHVTVEKTPIVKEEVSVSKRKVQGIEQVTENLRKEEIKIDKQGNANVRDKRK